jgi:hypothetical protein
MNISKLFRKKFILPVACLATSACLFAQNSTSSPLSIFGIGEIEHRDFGITTGLSNVGIGLKSENFLNRRNPAGLSGIDTLKFIFDISVGVKLSQFTTATKDERTTDFNFKNLAVGFRVSKRWTTSVGLAPYTNVGYSIAKLQQVEGSSEYFNTVYSGNGGVNKFYWGNSVELIRGLSVGATASYFFGTITRNESAKSIVISETMTANKAYLDFGIQYTYTIKQHTQLTVGGVYGYKSDFNMYQNRTIAYNTGAVNKVISDKKTNLPESFGGGFSIWRHKQDHEWLFAADYYQQNWSVNKDRLRGIVFADSRTYSAGFQLIPNSKRPEGYLHIMRYQIGARYNESYMAINGYQLKDYSVSLGVGLPFMNHSYVNVSVNYGQSGTGERGGITENYILLSTNLSLVELWFAKKKFK